MAKATHLGTCQACGRQQMLPSGRLSDHGYEVRDGWRRGSCMGAGHKPYEESTDLIESCIAQAIASAARKRDLAAVELAVPMGDLNCWRKVYHRELSSRTKGSVYLWHKGRVEGERFKLEFVYGDRPTDRDRVHAGAATAEGLASDGRKAYAESLIASAGRSDAYAKAQTRRIADWQPKPLTPRLIK